MEQYRSRKRGSGKTFHGSYETLDPARSAGTRSGRDRRHAPPRSRSRSSRAQYVARPAHRQRGGRGPRPRSAQRRRGVVLAALIGVTIAAVALGAFLLTRPGSVALAAVPADAMILFDGATTGSGSLELEDLDPGTYAVHAERTGFEPLDTTIEVKRGRTSRLEIALAPLPQQLSVTTHPEGASCVVTLASGETLTGTTPFEQEVPAGPMTLSLSLAGYNTFEREMFCDSALALEYYLDPEGQVLHGLGLITTQGAPKGVSVTHDGSEAWTSILNGPPSIQIFDPRTGAILGGVDIGEHGAVEVIFNKAGTLAYTSQMETAKCFEIDVKTRAVLREFDTQSSWTKWVALSPDEKTLYASNWSGHDVSVIDLASGDLVKRIRVSQTPRGMYATADGTALYVAGFDSGYLDRIDLATGEVTAVFKDGGALRHIVGDEKTGRLFISDMSKDLVWAHDMATGTTKKFVDTDKKPNTIDLTPDGRMLFVSCRGENNAKSYYLPGPEWGSILVFDTADGRPLDALIAGNQPTALDVSDDGTMLIFSDFLDDRLRVYEIPPYEEFAAGGGGRYDAHFAGIKK